MPDPLIYLIRNFDALKKGVRGFKKGDRDPKNKTRSPGWGSFNKVSLALAHFHLPRWGKNREKRVLNRVKFGPKTS